MRRRGRRGRGMRGHGLPRPGKLTRLLVRQGRGVARLLERDLAEGLKRLLAVTLARLTATWLTVTRLAVPRKRLARERLTRTLQRLTRAWELPA
jgi:hypothetical protein